MNLAATVTKKSLIDYYLECGLSGHFLSVSALLFFGFLWAAVGNPRVFHRFLMPASMLALVIGIFGSASACYSYLRFVPNFDGFDDAVFHLAYIILPLIVGSFLTMLFIVISLVFQFIHRRTLAGLDDRP